MALRQGETGKTIRVKGGFDMSSNTALQLTFYKPSGTIVTKTKAASQVTLGTGAVTDDDLGALSANTYVEYDTESGFADEAGTWRVYLTYTNTTPTPDDVFIGATSTFTVTAVP